MFLVGTLIAATISAVLILGVFLFFKKKSSGAGGAEQQKKVAEINSLITELKSMGSYADAYASKAQLQTVMKQLDEARIAVETQKNQLKEIETKLDTAQKAVEEKETAQQELKSVNENEETKLAEILERYEQISQESIALEQQLALSMKNLDTIMSEVTLSDDQRATLEEFSNALVAAGSRLRDLITEYEVSKERLENLKTQHTDLEEEYTRLVEQQLGE